MIAPAIKLHPIPAPRHFAETALPILQALDALPGCRVLGWLRATLGEAELHLRLHAHQRQSVLISWSGLAARGRFHPLALDLCSRCADGAWVTTTNSPVIEPQPAKQLFKFSHPRAGLPTLLRHHRAHSHPHGGPLPLDLADLPAARRLLEIYLRDEAQA